MLAKSLQYHIKNPLCPRKERHPIPWPDCGGWVILQGPQTVAFFLWPSTFPETQAIACPGLAFCFYSQESNINPLPLPKAHLWQLIHCPSQPPIHSLMPGVHVHPTTPDMSLILQPLRCLPSSCLTRNSIRRLFFRTKPPQDDQLVASSNGRGTGVRLTGL